MPAFVLPISLSLLGSYAILVLRYLHFHFLQNRIIVVDFKWQGKIEHDIGSIARHIALDDRRLVRVDNNKGQRNLFIGNDNLAVVWLLTRSRRRSRCRRLGSLMLLLL